MPSTHQLLVLSPDRTIRQLACDCADSLGHGMLTARTADEARQALSRASVDLACVDSVVPDADLEDLWGWLVSDRSRPAPAVVLLAPRSTKTLTATVPSFYRRRRDGLVTKPIDSTSLSREIARVLEKKAGEGVDRVLRVGNVGLDRSRQEILFDGGASIRLTPTELRLVSTLMERAGEYLPTEVLLRQVWNFPPETGGAEIVRAHVSNIRRKLRERGQNPHLVHTVPYRGYAFIESTT